MNQPTVVLAGIGPLAVIVNCVVPHVAPIPVDCGTPSQNGYTNPVLAMPVIPVTVTLDCKALITAVPLTIAGAPGSKPVATSCRKSISMETSGILKSGVPLVSENWPA